MSIIQQNSIIESMIYLCGCAVNEVTPKPEVISSIDLDLLFEVANKHKLAAMIGLVLKSIGVTTSHFKNAIALAQRATVILNGDLANVVSAFESSGIWYMPLKGAILKEYYPKFAMREMCDCDILIDETRAADVKAIMERLGFQVKRYGIYNDDDYLKPPVSSFEMHRSLFGDMHDKKLYEYYKQVKNILLKDENNEYGYHFSLEDFYIFMIAHEYKHYNMGGTGLRSLLDTYVFLQKNELDMAYVKAELEKLGIRDYEKKSRSLSNKLFSYFDEELTKEDQQMLEYIISSGTYGSLVHQIENTIHETGKGKLQYIVRRFFEPFSKDDPHRKHYRRKYATFFKHPILLPFLPFYRLFKALRTDPKRIRSEANALRKAGKATR